MKLSSKKSSQGFTLIELLIVIAVLGVLAAVVLVAINPLEQLARGRDAGRKNSLGQLYNAVLAFYTAREGKFPAQAAWVDGMVTAGEMKVPPSSALGATYQLTGSAACTSNASYGFCYVPNGTGDLNGVRTGATDAIVYVRLESAVENNKCTGSADGAVALFFWHYAEAKAGIVCSGGDRVLVATYSFVQ